MDTQSHCKNDARSLGNGRVHLAGSRPAQEHRARRAQALQRGVEARQQRADRRLRVVSASVDHYGRLLRLSHLHAPARCERVLDEG